MYRDHKNAAHFSAVLFVALHLASFGLPPSQKILFFALAGNYRTGPLGEGDEAPAWAPHGQQAAHCFSNPTLSPSERAPK